jgi:hypothetical protein
VTTAFLRAELHIALILLLSARNGETVIHVHTIDQYFLKFRFDRSYVTALGAGGGLIHKYVHCSGEYCLLAGTSGCLCMHTSSMPMSMAISA